VKIGVILTVSGCAQPGGDSPEENDRTDASQVSVGPAYGYCHVLGKPLVERVIDRFEHSGINTLSVVSEDVADSHLFPSRAASASKFISAWERAVSDQINQGKDVLLLARLGSYIELDLDDLLLFHRQNGSVLTQVYDKKGVLDMAVVNADDLRKGTGSYRSRLSAEIPRHRHYMVGGYVNRLKQASDFRRLTQDALLGQNSIRPAGEEVTAGVWMAPGCRVDSSASILGPAYIGEKSRVKAFCRIAGATTIERDCEVDCGTQVDNSSVLPGTFLGAGLRVTNSIVSPGKLFHIDRNIEVIIADNRLIGKTFHKNSIAGMAKSIFRKKRSRKSYYNQPAVRNSASIPC
jgi:hypothetical protein